MSGDSQYGINANTKIQPNSITSNLLANNLTYGSDLTITGNLSVTGNVTAIDTTNVTIEDPLLLLASTQTGAPSVDIGFIGQRGSENNIALIWNEANTTFATVYTDSGAGDNTTANILGYADLVVANANVTGTLNAANLSFTGNVTGNLDVTGYVNAGNITTTGSVSATGNVTGNYFIGNGSQLTGITSDAIYNGNSSANINTPDGNLVVSIGTNSNLVATFYDNGLSLTNELSAGGNVTASNFATSGSGGNITGANLISAVTFTATGSIYADNNISAVGNIIGGNVSTLGNIYGNYVVTSGTTINGGVSTTGNVISNQAFIGNTLTGNALQILSDASGINLSTTGNINVNNSYINNLLDPQQAQDAATKQYVDTVASGLDLKQSCLVGTTIELDNISGVTNVVYYNGPANDGVGATLTITTTSQLFIDGVNVSTLGTGANARVLIKNEATVPTATSDAAWNGIYVITSAAIGAGTTVITRSADFDNEGALGSMPGSFTFLQEGTAQTATGWVCISANPIVVGTTPITWAQFSGAQNYTAGNAIAINGTVITALYDGSTIGVNGSNQLYIPANAPLTTPNIGQATGSSLSVTGNVQANNVFATTNLSASGDVLSGADISATGNVNVTDVNATGNVSAQGNIVADVFQGTTASVTGNIYSTYASINGNVDASNVNVTGNVYIAGNPIGYAAGTNNQIQFNENNNFTADANLTFDPAAGLFATSNVSVSGNIIVSNTLLPDTDQGAEIGTGTQAFNNIYTYGISGENQAGSVLTVNPNQQPNDFSVSTSTAVNVLYVSDTNNSVSVGSDIQTTGASFAVNTTDSILVPVGNIAQRPATGVTGMFRWNTSYSYLEVYDGTAWIPVGFEQYTVIQNEQFNGDGTTTQFTLGSSQTTDSCIVTINGVLQAPTTAYSVSGVYPACVLTFTEAPLVDDTIEVRELTTTTTVTAISNSSSNAVVSTDPNAANVNITGNLVVAAGGYLYGNGAYLTGISGGGSNVDLTNVTTNIIPSSNAVLTLGNATNQWAELYVSNASIIMGGVPLTSNGNTLSFAGNALVSTTSGGNINVAGILSASGNVISANMFTAGVVSAQGNVRGGNINTVGLVSATGNVYGSYFIGNGATLSSIAGANVTGTVDNATNAVNATVATVVSGSAQGNITSVGTLVQLSSTGNITGANFRTTGLITATGNVYGNFFIGDGSQLTGVTASGVAAGALTGNTLSANVTTSTLTSVGTLSSLSVSGNITAGNISATNHTGTTVSVTGNVTAGNLIGAIATASQTNITSVGTLSSLSVSGNIGSTGNITATNFIGNGALLTNINTSIISNGASNVSVAASNGNISVNVASAPDVVTISSDGISTTGNITIPTILFYANTIGSINDLVIDPLNDGTNTGNVIIQGNLDVRGTTTTVNSNNISINSLVYIAANNAPSASAANGGGLQVGNLGGVGFATLLYNSTANAWNTNIDFSAAGNVNGNNVNLTGYIASGNGVAATGTYTGAYTDGVVLDYVDGNARISAGSADGIQFYNNGIANVLLASITPTGGFNATGNIITTGLVSATGNVIGANLIGTIATASQTNITSVGTLTGVSASGNITTTGNISAAGNVSGSNINGTLFGIVATPTQTSITSVGTLLSLSVSGAITATSSNVTTATAATHNGTTVSVTGNVTGTNLIGNIVTAAQSNITSVGILTSLSSTGQVKAASLAGDGGNISNIRGANVNGTVATATTAGTVTGNAQANITSVGTLTSLSVSGNIDAGNINSAGQINALDGTNTLGALVVGKNHVGSVLNIQDTNGFNLGSFDNSTNDLILSSISGTRALKLLGNGSTGTGIVVNGSGNVSITNTTSSTSTTTGALTVLGGIGSSGNVIAGNLITGGFVSATGNVTGNYIIGNGSTLSSITGANVTGTVALATTAGTVTTAAQPNVTSLGTVVGLSASGAIYTSGNMSATGNVNVVGTISSAGNITAPNFIGTLATASQPNITSVGILTGVNTSGNISAGGNIVAGIISASGNILGAKVGTANGFASVPSSSYDVAGQRIYASAAYDVVSGGAYQFGDGSFPAAIKGVSGAVGYIQAFINNDPTSEQLWYGNYQGLIVGNGTSPVANLDVRGTMNVSSTATTGNLTATNLYTGGLVSATGNVYGSNFVTGTGTGGNVTGANVISANTISASTVINTPSIVNNGTSAVGNIGSSSVPFNTIFARATSAQYADLAEKYLADAEYAPGTVVVFGGSSEVTVSPEDSDRRVAGVVSTNPSYIMNGGLEGEHVVTVALTGRVPCCVRGKVRKGDLMVSAGYGAARAEADPRVGTVIGKALEDFDGEEGVIEVVVGRV